MLIVDDKQSLLDGIIEKSKCSLDVENDKFIISTNNKQAQLILTAIMQKDDSDKSYIVHFTKNMGNAKIEYMVRDIKIKYGECKYVKKFDNESMTIEFTHTSIESRIIPTYDYSDWTYLSNRIELEMLMNSDIKFLTKIDEETGLMMVKQENENEE